MRRHLMLVSAPALVIALSMTTAACSSGSDEPAAEAVAKTNEGAYRAAIADIARTDAERTSDATRKPVELLAFAEVMRGEKVGDYIMGGGYVTKLLAATVGAEGRVYAFQPDEFIAYRSEYATEQDAAVEPFRNVTALRGPIGAPPFPEPLDTIITVMNFHDLYLKPMSADTGSKASAALFAALKPGGTLVVVDHAAASGSGTSAADTLHRIDKQAVIDALTAAGFTLEQDSTMYARSDDPHTANVFDSAIRGKTDQFSLRFRKPG
ncbi:methyltransferase [Altererythrobacter xixiisoli]|uniref:Methyltransferase n=1 Tax=Croceibacterium xixiisoli TaxID=1476466 RepID=A0A6I4TY49_9SPHN|nr:class I SAM-dependent methyltransferase [Croceibacterium xixiisoli]MXP00201.1 methyltransferase [Croceibacterium xixiisoli]